MRELLLLAATGLAREVLVTVRASGQFDVLGILDDDPELLGVTIDGAAVLGTIDDAVRYERALLAVCIPAPRDREAAVATLAQLGIGPGRYASVVDADVRIPDDCRIGPGSILLHGAILGPHVRLGNHVVVMPGAKLGWDAHVGDFSTLSAGSALGERVRVGRAASIGMNAGVAEGLSIGNHASLGMGAAVLQDVPDNETWVGVPAHRFRPGRGMIF